MGSVGVLLLLLLLLFYFRERQRDIDVHPVAFCTHPNWELNPPSVSVQDNAPTNGVTSARVGSVFIMVTVENKGGRILFF